MSAQQFACTAYMWDMIFFFFSFDSANSLKKIAIMKKMRDIEWIKRFIIAHWISRLFCVFVCVWGLIAQCCRQKFLIFFAVMPLASYQKKKKKYESWRMTVYTYRLHVQKVFTDFLFLFFFIISFFYFVKNIWSLILNSTGFERVSPLYHYYLPSFLFRLV